MKNPIDTALNAGELHQRAEQQLAAKQETEKGKPLNEKRLFHELQVHQIELEMQNEALQEARATAELALERYAELFDFAPIAYFILGADGIIQQTNFRGGLLLGLERSNLVGKPFAHCVSCEYRAVFSQFLRNVFASVRDGQQHCEVVLRDGDNIKWVTMEATADTSRQACLTAVVDITERKRSEQELQLAATVYLTMEEAVMVTDVQNRIIAVNPAFSRLSGYTAEEAVGQSAAALLECEIQGKAFYQQLWNTLDTIGHWQGELWNRRKNGEMYLKWLSVNTVYGENHEAIRRVATSSDITDKKRAEEIMLRQANIDPLTELPNRRMFFDRLGQAIKKSHREGKQLALMFLDLDHFKDINDTFGHDIGDELLKKTTQRLQACIRETDTLARLGGDEFTVIMSELDDLKSVERVAQSILQSMTASFQLKNERCYVSFSIGISLCPDDANDVDDLLKKADQAMYAAKQHGRNRLCYFAPAMQEAAETRLMLTNDLHDALATHQFWVAYQPIVELATGDIHKAEALIRWQHPTLGLISPAEFIPLAEETGMIIAIGEWVFHQAAQQVEKWRAHGHPLFQISVNKSPAQFGENQTDWFQYLQHLGLPGTCIVVEITEGLLLDVSPIVAAKLLAFRDTGMQVSLDDFGTGYLSLSFLKKFHIDYLKIDQNFICNLTTNLTDFTLCEAIILMAHKLGMKVIAEGIETPEQCDLLLLAGCDYGQGYLFSKPVSAEEFEKLFNN
jgi:diguanylate cyclase (GGDEF)-like protein/PAS domain S-box-containing protein